MLSENIARRLLAPILLACALAPAFGATRERLRGTLAPPTADEALQLVSPEGVRTELAVDESHDRTMRDPQLANRLWEVRGRFQGDGRFAAERIFTVKDGQLHRVTYYCVICHITTHEPGRCMCCQGDTDLREIPDPEAGGQNALPADPH